MDLKGCVCMLILPAIFPCLFAALPGILPLPRAQIGGGGERGVSENSTKVGPFGNWDVPGFTTLWPTYDTLSYTASTSCAIHHLSATTEAP